MRLNADFSQPVVVRPEDYRWVDSPVAGVERMMLDRIGDEVARATSLVRYAPDSSFTAHEHGGGEEILVLEGAFGDEHGSYPAGTYLRNPIGTRHSPRIGSEGALILVKLHQFDPQDQAHFQIDTRSQPWSISPDATMESMLLHHHGRETVMLQKWTSGERLERCVPEGGEELLVLRGSFSDEQSEYPMGTWIRRPAGFHYRPLPGEEGVKIWIKTGHLP